MTIRLTGDLTEAKDEVHLLAKDGLRKVVFVLPDEAVREGMRIWSDRHWRTATEIRRRWSDVENLCDWAYRRHRDSRTDPVRIRLTKDDLA